MNDEDAILQLAGASTSGLTDSLQPPAPGLEEDSLMAVRDIVLDKG